MKTMKFLARRVSALVLVATVGLTALVPAAFAAPASLPDLPKDQCVVDDANVLSSSTVQTIQDLNTQLDARCKGAQIGVLTVDYTGSVSTEDYAVEAANTWGLGSSSENNGVLILLVMQSPKYADGDYYLRRRLPKHNAGQPGQCHRPDHGGRLCLPELRWRRDHLCPERGQHHCGHLWCEPQRFYNQ